MSTLGVSSTSPSSGILITLATVSISVVAFVAVGRLSVSEGKKLKKIKLPPNAWLSHGSFASLEAMVDTFFPGVNLSELSKERLQELASSLGVSMDENGGLNGEDMKSVERFLTMSASDYGTAKHVMNAIKNVCSKTDQSTLALVLYILSTTFGSLLLTGYPVPFHELPLHIREKILCNWRDSSLEPLRGIYQIFKRMTSLFFMSFMHDGLTNPTWEALGYDPMVARLDVKEHLEKSGYLSNASLLREMISYEYVSKSLFAQKIDNIDHISSVDVVIIGSGSGGGMMAHCLVTAGYSVLVLEKGPYLQPEQFSTWREMDSITNAFEKGGLTMSEDGNFAIFAGACVGGGSTINWSASFATPPYVLEDWKNSGLTAFGMDKGGEYQHSMDEVHRLLNVNCDHSHTQHHDAEHCVVNENNRLLYHAAEKLGYTPEKVPRNVKNCIDCGHCCYGCGYNNKQSTVAALMEPLLLSQAKGLQKGVGKLYIIPDCRVDTILHTHNTATGVTATATLYGDFMTTDNQRYSRPVLGIKALKITSKMVVCSAGSLHTPAILLRSGLKDKYDGIGRGLCLHPVIPTIAIMPKDINTGLNRGVSMGVVVRNPPVCHRNSQLTPAQQEDELRHPVALETPPIHPAMLGTLLPWNKHDGLAFKLAALQYKQLAVFIGIARDRSHRDNRIVIDNRGEPVVKYTLNAKDIPMLEATLEAQLRHHFMSGAKIMCLTHNNFPWFIRRDNESEIAAYERFESYLQEVRKESVKPMRAQLYTAHQMSSCRMAAKNQDGPVKPSGELYCCENLFVADGSILPTSLGINPMVTIESMAHLVAKSVVAKLKTM